MKINKGWKLKKLEQIAEIKSGSTPLRSKGKRYFTDNGIQWVKTGDLTNGYIYKTNEQITETAIEESSCQIFPEGTVLVAMYGGFNQIGRTGLLTRPAAINQAISALIMKNGEVNNLFVLYWLNSNIELWKKFAASSRKDPNITRSDVCKFPILIPPSAQQSVIVNILSGFDSAIEKTKQLIRAKEVYKRGLTIKLLSKFTQKFIVKMSDLFKKVTERNDEGNSLVLTISGKHGVINQEHFFDKNVAGENLCNYYLIKKGDFAYNRSFMSGYPYGAIKRLDEYSKGVLSTLYVCFRLTDTQCESDFYKHYFESGLLNEGLSEIVQMGARAHGLLNLSMTDFFSLKVPKPPLAEQKEKANIMNMLEKELILLKKKLELLKLQKKALMQQLLTGRLRVKTKGEK